MPVITTSYRLRFIVLIQRAAIEGEVSQQDNTPFGQQFKVDWRVPHPEIIQLRTIWEITLTNPNPRLISAFLKLHEKFKTFGYRSHSQASFN